MSYTPSVPINQGSAVIDWGSVPTDEALVEVTGQAGIKSTSQARAWIQGGGPYNADQMLAGPRIEFVCGTPLTGNGFTIKALALVGLFTGLMTIQWQWDN